MKNEGLPSVDKRIITLSGEIGKDMKEILFLKKAIASHTGIAFFAEE